MNVLIEKTETIQDELYVDTRQDYKELKNNMKDQRDENELLYKTLKDMTKSTSSQRQKVSLFQAKIEELEQHVGIINTDYEAQNLYGTNDDPKMINEYDEQREWNLGPSPMQGSIDNDSRTNTYIERTREKLEGPMMTNIISSSP